MTLSWDLDRTAARMLRTQLCAPLRTAAWMLLIPVVSYAQANPAAPRIDLPSSKSLGWTPGHPQRTNSLPASIAISPDGRYVVTVNAGYGTAESRYFQSLAVLDTQTGELRDFPEPRTGVEGEWDLYSGLAFSADGRHLYAALDSMSDPDGGNNIAVYRFNAGRITPERLINVGVQNLAGTRRTTLPEGTPSDRGVSFPAAIAVTGSKLLVADNLSDDALLLDSATGRVVHRFDLSETDAVPSTYPIAVAISKDSTHAYVALWNSSEVAELDLTRGTVTRKLPLLKPSDPLKPGTHPCALTISPDGNTLYIALSNRDAIAAVDISRRDASYNFAVKGYFDTRLPDQSYFGAEPDALSLNADGSRLYAANLGSSPSSTSRNSPNPPSNPASSNPSPSFPRNGCPPPSSQQKTGSSSRPTRAVAPGPTTSRNAPTAKLTGRTCTFPRWSTARSPRSISTPSTSNPRPPKSSKPTA
jgi:DNA-binding beta-propeller fold protein YncE